MIAQISPVAESDLPFEPDATPPHKQIAIESTPDAEARADGETEPFGWINLREMPDGLSRLIDADEIVVVAASARLVLSYPLDVSAVRVIAPGDGRTFMRRELVQLIDETYREVYAKETATQSEPTPAIADRGLLLNRPASDGTFGIWGHDLDDLAIEGINVYVFEGEVWVHPEMGS